MGKKEAFLGGYILNNRYSLFASSLFIVLGSVVSSIYLVKSFPNQKEEIEGALLTLLNCQNVKEAFLQAILSASQIWMIMYLSALVSVGKFISPILVGIKSFLACYTSAALIYVYGPLGALSASAGMLSLIFTFPALQIMAAAAYNEIEQRQFLADRRKIRRGFLTYSIFDALLFLMLLVGAAVDIYISRFLMAEILL